MPDIKLIATDIDGTLFDSNKGYNVSRLNHYLDLLHQQNIQFAIASGNNYDHLQKIFQKTPNLDFFIAENGSQIVANQKTIFERTLSKKLVDELIHILTDKLDLKAISLSGKKASYAESKENQPLYHINNLVCVDDLTSVDDDFFKINLQLKHDDLDSAAQFLNDNYGDLLYAAVSGFGSIDIMSANTNKSIALAHLCDLTDISLENVMSFGDNTNDLEMIQESGLGVAMKNAKQSIIDNSDLVTQDDNDHDGVLNTIETVLNL